MTEEERRAKVEKKFLEWIDMGKHISGFEIMEFFGPDEKLWPESIRKYWSNQCAKNIIEHNELFKRLKKAEENSGSD